MEDREIVLGIDLGTTYSCVAYWDWQKKGVEVIPNSHGHRTTPSYVSFSPSGEVIVGDAAKQRQTAAVASTIYNAKRVIGRSFDQLRASDLSSWPFEIVRSDTGKPRFRIEHPGAEPLDVSPEQVSAHVLSYLKQTAERHLGRKITKAVVTVPAYFCEPQRMATKDAAALAGLEVVKLLTEPTAAALAYGLDESGMASRTPTSAHMTHVLVVDLGGGTFDVSALKLDGHGSFVTRAVAGDFHLGGEDFDQRVLAYVVDRFRASHPDVELSKRSLRRLRTECQAAKHALSSTQQAHVDVEVQGVDLSLTLTRQLLEDLCDDLLTSVIAEVANALDLANIDASEIDDVVLVGGSTRIPAVSDRLQAFFGGSKNICRSINPDEAVAYGAAVQGAALAAPTAGAPGGAGTGAPPGGAAAGGGGLEKLRNLVLTNVTPLTLGVELSNGAMDVLIHRATRIPVSRSDYYTTAQDNQGSVIVKVYEGESLDAKQNSLLGKFSLPVQRAPLGVPKVEVQFSINSDGIFTVSARDLSTDVKQSIEIERCNSSNLTVAERERERAAVAASTYGIDADAGAAAGGARAVGGGAMRSMGGSGDGDGGGLSKVKPGGGALAALVARGGGGARGAAEGGGDVRDRRTSERDADRAARRARDADAEDRDRDRDRARRREMESTRSRGDGERDRDRDRDRERDRERERERGQRSRGDGDALASRGPASATSSRAAPSASSSGATGRHRASAPSAGPSRGTDDDDDDDDDAYDAAAAARAREALSKHLYQCQRALRQHGAAVSPADKAAVMDLSDDVMQWLDDHPTAAAEEVALQRSMFDVKWAPIARRLPK